jgi:hypothetical protein
VEDEAHYLALARLGQLSWNFELSKQHSFPSHEYMQRTITEIFSADPELRKPFDFLLQRKESEFKEYIQFILEVEIREKKDGSKKLHVSSAPADKFDKLDN